MNKQTWTKTVLALALAVPALASAESNLSSGVGTITAAANLDFRIIIPKVLFLAVGTGAAGSALTASGTVDQVSFDYSSNGAAIGSGAAAGAITGNVVPVRVVGNNGVITLSATTTGAINNGVAGDTIPWTQITAVSSDATSLPHPVIPATGLGTAVNIAVTSGKITNRTANWTYSYANSAVVAPGTYGGAGGANNSRVTYTVTML